MNPSGGLKAKGHPIGATGVSMHALTAMQLMGEAPEGMQVKGAKLGGVFNMGGVAVAKLCERARAREMTAGHRPGTSRHKAKLLAWRGAAGHWGVRDLRPLLFAYLFSQFFRSFLTIVAADLTRDLGFDAGDLGWIGSSWFIAFAFSSSSSAICWTRSARAGRWAG